MLALMAVAPLADAEKVIEVRPNKKWTGTFQDEGLKKHQPADSGVITDKDTFATLWKAWMGDADLPTIDFTKQFVVVKCADKANDRGAVSTISLIVGENGDHDVCPGIEEANVKGFSFWIAAFDREGIKSVGGKALKK
jgi:hypothetical protein